MFIKLKLKKETLSLQLSTSIFSVKHQYVLHHSAEMRWSFRAAQLHLHQH